MSLFSDASILQFVRQALPEEAWHGPVAPLAGGAINQVCRIQGAARSVIFKHAPPHIASHPDIPLDDSRIHFEGNALKLFQQEPALQALLQQNIRPPRLIHHDTQLACLLLEDLGGGPSLGTIPTAQALQNHTILGRALGRFIGDLHRATRNRPDFAEHFNNRPVQQTRLQVQYLGTAELAETFALPKADLAEIRANITDLGQRLLEPGTCLIMGDLWPPSILPRENGLRLIDWEFTHYGQPLQDCAHLAAHCHMHARAAPTPSEARNWIEFWQAFVDGYGIHPLDAATLRDWNLHFAAECFMRTIGPFRSHGPFTQIDDEDTRLRNTQMMALDILKRPERPPIFAWSA